jgi:Neprosin
MATVRNRFCVALLVLASYGVLHAQTAANRFVPFANFVQKTEAATSDIYVARADSRVKDAAAFEEMRQYILTMYQGVHVGHSFVRDNNHVDCVPVMEQPSVRLLGLTEIATQPPNERRLSNGSTGDLLAGEQPVALTSQFDPEQPFDEFGNAMVCEDRTIPMARITLEQMTHFPTLREFFEKSPQESEASATLVPGHAIPPASAGTHVYSFTYSPNEKNKGLTDGNNLWSPAVTGKEIFSLSQLWEIGAKGSETQTAEAGWQVYPALYNIKKAALFIYWTADGYNNTGCYNLTCPAFVQTNNSVTLGAGFSHYSVKGGTQYEIDLEYKLTGGKWWFYFDGTAVGYYPAAQYKPGTMATYSTYSEYGTEAVSNSKLDPREGSGQWSTAGFGQAAYHRNLNYFSTAGKEIAVSLTADDEAPNCYSITGPFSNLAGWGTYFYDGGPGGSTC